MRASEPGASRAAAPRGVAGSRSRTAVKHDVQPKERYRAKRKN